jgi:predicted dehydrogenase
MPNRILKIIMNGVTGRMGRAQHLARSIMAIRQQGGLQLRNGETLWPEPILVGRNERRLRSLAEEHDLTLWTTDLHKALSDPDAEIYFDTQVTSERAPAVKAAIAAGKHVYCEKPIADDLRTAKELADLASRAGVKNGVVQDKLFLPGLRKLKALVENGFFGRILSVRGEFGYWVFEGDWQPAQRPSWNYRQEEGGGIIVDMFCHWRYVLDNLFRRCRITTSSTTALRSNGSYSSVTWSKRALLNLPCLKGRKAFSWRKPAWNPGANAVGYRSRKSRKVSMPVSVSGGDHELDAMFFFRLRADINGNFN